MDEVAARDIASECRPAAGPRPVVGIICCTRREGDHALHAVVEKYVVAAAEGAGAMPVLVPALDAGYAEDAVARLDGLLAPGSRSNVEPHHYGGPPSIPETGARSGARRHGTAAAPGGGRRRPTGPGHLPRHPGAQCRARRQLCTSRSMPCPAGSIIARPRGPFDERYGHRAHPVDLVAGGSSSVSPGRGRLTVNSLHGQASTVWRRGSPSRRRRPTARSRRCGCRRRASSWACSGTRNTGSGRPVLARALRRLRRRLPRPCRPPRRMTEP